MNQNKNNEKLGILIPGMGAVASTFVCGVIACNKGLSKPIGSMTQMGSIRLGKRAENRSPIIKDFVPVASMENLVFGGWDIEDENLYETSIRSKVLEKALLEELKSDLESIKVFKAVFDNAISGLGSILGDAFISVVTNPKVILGIAGAFAALFALKAVLLYL